jgi:membrane protein YdbS with pleckstrin-like domain
MNREPIPDLIRQLHRPDAALWRYYVIQAIFTGPGIIATLPYLYFRYHTLQYRFDEEGIHMKVGILFRREINLTYARIQDIHLRSGLLQRWLGLANVQVQTASGSSGPELTIEGFKQFEAIRDFLYTRMRGYQKMPTRIESQPVSPPPRLAAAVGEAGEVLSLLTGIRDELRRTREIVESQTANRSGDSPSPKARV